MNAPVAAPIITVRQFRMILVSLDDQNMSIAELRLRLFALNDQDVPIEVTPSIWRKLGVV